MLDDQSVLSGESVPHPCLVAAAAAASVTASSPGHGCLSPAPPRSGLAPTLEWPEKTKHTWTEQQIKVWQGNSESVRSLKSKQRLHNKHASKRFATFITKSCFYFIGFVYLHQRYYSRSPLWRERWLSQEGGALVVALVTVNKKMALVIGSGTSTGNGYVIESKENTTID